MKPYISLFVLCLIIRSGFGMGGPGSGSSGGGTSSGGGSNMSQIEERYQAVRLYDQGVRAMNSKRFAEAEARFAQALRNSPRFAEAHNYLGMLLLKMDRKSAAEKDLATLRTINPGRAVELERVMKKVNEASGSVVKQGGQTR
jgi:TolA-binding protein